MRTKNTDLKDVWQTPEWLTDLLQPIDLDPCAGENTNIGKDNLTQDGTLVDWYGEVFVNPPIQYEREIFTKGN